MGKDKAKRFAENLTFDSLVQAEFEDIFHKDHPLKGRWKEAFFHNQNPIVLELGCGRGEYTVALARMQSTLNFIGVDIKGARLWRGAKTVTDEKLTNGGFLRTRIEFIDSFFAQGEVDRIWITFPDPQLKRQRAKKRLTSPEFLSLYARFLKSDGSVNLKTDSQELYTYTMEVCRLNNLVVEEHSDNIYAGQVSEELKIKTKYEEQFLAQGKTITYIRFRLNGLTEFVAPKEQDDEE